VRVDLHDRPSRRLSALRLDSARLRVARTNITDSVKPGPAQIEEAATGRLIDWRIQEQDARNG
jgi:hypothetical protein